MTIKAASVSTDKFKASCLTLLVQVADMRREIVVTKRRKPIAKVVPVDKHGPASLVGSVVRENDLVSPTGATWEAA